MKISQFLFLSIFCSFLSENVQAQTGLIANKAMVVSAREEASKIGVEIMQKEAMLLMLWWLPNWLWQLLIRMREI